MRNKNLIKLTKEIKNKLDRLSKLQEQLLESKEMIGASLIKRYLGTRDQKRSSYAFYLSTSKKGRTTLHHISKKEVASVETRVIAWKNYQKSLREWQTLTHRIYQDFKQIGTNIKSQNTSTKHQISPLKNRRVNSNLVRL